MAEDRIDLLGIVFEDGLKVFSTDGLNACVVILNDCGSTSGFIGNDAHLAEESNCIVFCDLLFFSCAIVYVHADRTLVKDIHAVVDCAFLEDDHALSVILKLTLAVISESIC